MLKRALTTVLIAALVVAGLELPARAASNGTLLPDAKRTFLDNNGNPCNGCLLFFYTAGTSTKQTAYSDVALSVALSNPTVLDSSGRVSAGGPFGTPGQSFKQILAPSTDSDPPVAPIWTQDNIQVVPPTGTATDVDIAGTAGENMSAGDAVFLSDGAGGNTTGRWYKADADQVYSSSTAQTVGFATTAITTGSSGTIRRGGRITGLSGLSAGVLYFVSATAGALTSTAPANSRAILQADATTAGVILTGAPDATATVGGQINTGAQTFTGDKTGAGIWSFTGHPKFEPGTSTGTYANMNGVIFTDTGPRSATATSAEQDFTNVSLPAGVLESTNGKMVRIVSWGTAANTAGAKILRHYFGATSLSGTLATHTASVGTERWFLQSIVQRRDATNQRGICHVRLDENGLEFVDRLNQTSPAETLSGAVTIRTTTQNAGGASADTVQEGFYVEILG